MGLIIDCFAGGGGASVGIEMAAALAGVNCPYLKVGERTPNLRIDDTEMQLKFA